MIRKASTALGVGLLQAGLEREGRKGCSPIMCMEPASLEPPYQRFDAQYILGQAKQAQASESPEADFVTFDVYPAEEDQLSITWMETMLRALSVLGGPMAFELYGGMGRVWVRFAVQRGQVAGFKVAVLGHFPALRLQRVTKGFPRKAPTVNELYPVGPYHRSLTLLGKEGASPLGLAATVIAGHQGQGLFQVLFCPARPSHDWHYNVENMVEAELRAAQMAQLGGLSTDFAYDHELPPLMEPAVREKVRVDVSFLAVVVRFAVWGEDQEEFLQGMRVATGMLRFGNRAWRVLSHQDLVASLGSAKVVRSVVAKRLSYRPGLMLTSREVASLVHIPNARTLLMLASIQQRFGFEWQPLDDDGSQQARLGVNDYAGSKRRVNVPMSTRLRHMYIAGTTGHGKSKLIERMAVDDAESGVGFGIVDPHGDLCMDILEKLPEERMKDLVYVSFSEQDLVPRWNPFCSKLSPGKLADDMAKAFMAQTSTTGPRMEHNFRMIAYIVHELEGTLDDFAELAGKTKQGDTLREQALDKIGNPQVQRFLKNDLPKASPRDLASVTNKLSRLLLDDQLGAMFRQEENTLDPRDWMDKSRTVLVNLSSGFIGADHARFVGSLLVSLIYRAALTRADLPQEMRTPFLLYIDEFQQLQSATLSEILSEGRKYGLGTVLAHQERGQLGKELAQALGNCATKIVFKPGEDDLPYFHRVFGSLDPDVLRRLGIGQAIITSGAQVASLRTELCNRPVLRDPRKAARLYAEQHYLSVGKSVVPKRRPRTYDTFGESS